MNIRIEYSRAVIQFVAINGMLSINPGWGWLFRLRLLGVLSSVVDVLLRAGYIDPLRDERGGNEVEEVQ